MAVATHDKVSVKVRFTGAVTVRIPKLIPASRHRHLAEAFVKAGLRAACCLKAADEEQLACDYAKAFNLDLDQAELECASSAIDGLYESKWELLPSK